MTEEEATEIVERYELLLSRVVGANPGCRFEHPLEVADGAVFAWQTERVDGDFIPHLRRRELGRPSADAKNS